MSVLVYVENWKGAFKKSSFEAVGYATNLASGLGTTVTAVCLGNVNDANELGKYGADKVVVLAGFDQFNSNAFASAIQQIAQADGAKTIVVSGTNNGKNVAPILSIKHNAALVSNVVATPSSYNPLIVRKSTFSSKAFSDFQVNTENVVLSIIPNSIGISENNKVASIENSSVDIASDMNAEVTKQDLTTGKIPLPEADIVVSAGRGLKGPENWGMIEELASLLNAGTACSKPVSDIGWRPHSEHVGQTGIQINPNLYIAVGISGAIQHLAGVSASKTIVVINTDPEAPFFKAADYGIVGDAFEVVPKLTEAIKAFMANS